MKILLISLAAVAAVVLVVAVVVARDSDDISAQATSPTTTVTTHGSSTTLESTPDTSDTTESSPPDTSAPVTTTIVEPVASTTTVLEQTTTTTTVSTETPTTVAPATSSITTTIAPAGTTSTGKHYVFDQDTTITSRFVLRAGDSVELRNGACLCFSGGGSADWQGTPTSTWSDDGRKQNLIRDIKFTGNGHIRFMHGATTSIIKFVEIDLRPPLELGKYPLHFHHAGDGVRGTIVEGVVVKNSGNRAFVPHGSHGITFRDTIAKNIAGSPYWWDGPPFQSDDQSENSNDIHYEHALADGVTSRPGDSPVRLAAFTLGRGTGNSVVNSVAMHVQGGKDSAGFAWPESSQRQPLTWRFRNNVAHDNAANGIFVWQNNHQDHVIDGFRGYGNGLNDIDHGAYKNRYDYRNIVVDRVEIHALGWSVAGGSIGTVTARKHALEGDPVTFTDVAVGALVIQNARNGGDVAGTYVFSNTGLQWANVTLEDYVPGTTVVIDGETRTF